MVNGQHQTGRIVFVSPYTHFSSLLEKSSELGWKLVVDTYDPNTLHFNRKLDDGDVHITVTFPIGPNGPISNAVLWRDAQIYGDGQIWIPKPIREVQEFDQLMGMLESEDSQSPGSEA